MKINIFMFIQVNTPRYGNIFIVADRIADLRTVDSAKVQPGYSAIIAGDLIPADGLGGIYVWIATSILPDDGENIIAPADGSTGRWHAISVGRVGPQGLQGPIGIGAKGDPGGNVSDAGTFAAAKQLTIPAGTTTIRLSDRGKAVFERHTGIDLVANYASSESFWWFRDASGARWIMNADAGINMLALGASTEAGFDNSDHFDQASIFAGLTGARRILLPRGNLRISRAWLNPSGLSIQGQGKGVSMIESTTFNDGALYLTGAGASFRGFTKYYNVQRGTRGSAQFTGHAITVIGATYFTVEDVLIDGSPNAGVLMYASQFGSVKNCDARDLEADAFHVTGGFGSNPCTDIVVSDCTARDCGDDHFPVVSYLVDGAPVQRVTFANCRSIGGDARAFACVGGQDILFIDCFAKDANCSGLLIDTDGTSGGTAGNVNITARNMTIINCGRATNPLYAGLQIRGLPERDAVNISVDGCRLIGSKNEGIYAFGLNGGLVRGLDIINTTIEGAFYAGIRTDNVVDQRIEGNHIKQTRAEAILATNAKGGLRINNNDWEAAGTAGTPECSLSGDPLNGAKQVRGNASRVGIRLNEGLASSAFIVAPFTGLDIASNYAEDGKPALFGVGGTDKQLSRADPQADSTAAATEAAAAAPTKAEHDATAAAVNTLALDLNALLVKLRAAGLIAN